MEELYNYFQLKCLKNKTQSHKLIKKRKDKSNALKWLISFSFSHFAILFFISDNNKTYKTHSYCKMFPWFESNRIRVLISFPSRVFSSLVYFEWTKISFMCGFFGSLFRRCYWTHLKIVEGSRTHMRYCTYSSTTSILSFHFSFLIYLFIYLWFLFVCLCIYVWSLVVNVQ